MRGLDFDAGRVRVHGNVPAAHADIIGEVAEAVLVLAGTAAEIQVIIPCPLVAVAGGGRSSAGHGGIGKEQTNGAGNGGDDMFHGSPFKAGIPAGLCTCV